MEKRKSSPKLAEIKATHKAIGEIKKAAAKAELQLKKITKLGNDIRSRAYVPW